MKIGDIFTEKRRITKEEMQTMQSLSTKFQKNSNSLPVPRATMQTILGSLVSGLVATMVPQTIYVEQQTEYKDNIKEDQEFEVRVTVREINLKNRRASLLTQILADSGKEKPLEVATGKASVKLPKYAVD